MDNEAAATLATKRLDLFGDGSAFLLEDVLTAQECGDLIRAAQESDLASCGDPMLIQVADTATMFSSSIASCLFARIKPFLAEELDLGSRGVRLDVRARRKGKWNPAGLNDRLQFCRYGPGGRFLPHYDPPYDNRGSCSVQTCILFLNDQGRDFEGGRARFYSDQQVRCEPGRAEHVVQACGPKAGCALVFNHLLPHDVEEITRGWKYIMKTEVMYTRRK